jgi:hypothetical protein
MAVFLSPGVFPREIDLSILPAGTGALRPAFIGAAQKGPINEPTLITSAQDFVNVFGDPFPESYLGYAVLAYLAEGNSCYVLRVAVEYYDGMDTDLADIAIDTSGSKVQGWGRIPVYTGIDNGIIKFRRVDDGLGSNPDPVTIHAPGVVGAVASVLSGAYNDASNDEVTGGPVEADLTFTDEVYTGCLDEVFTLTITGAPTGSGLDGATYIVTTSAGVTVASGTFDSGSGSVYESDEIVLTDSVDGYLGITFTVTVTGDVAVNDTIVFSAQPDNRSLTVEVDGVAETITLAAGSYATATAVVNAIIAAAPAAYTAVLSEDDNGNEVPAIRTDNAGERIQVTGTCATAAELGISQYTYDIPKSYLIGLEEGTYALSTSNNRVVLDVVGGDETIQFDFSLPTGSGWTAANIAAVIDANATYQTVDYFDSFAMTVPGGTSHVVIVASDARQFDQLKMQATFTYVQCLRFAEEIGIEYPYTRNYRSFWDARVELPEGSTTTPSVPASCEAPVDVDQCALDQDYYANIVGWFVAKYAGTWIDNYTLSLEIYTEGVGDVAGRYKVVVKDLNGVTQDIVSDVSFDSTEDRYIANVVNAGSTLGGVNGNDYYSWEARPAYLDALTTGPSPFTDKDWGTGPQNGIPLVASTSTALDKAVIGNPALSTGIYAFQNPESYDFNLLAIPGFASGPVIAQAIQFCENRGDVLFLVDPPYGLRPQQVIDWHNGMLTSDLASTLNSSYAALYWSWLKVNDLFEGGTIWVPPSGHIAGVFARTDREAEQWFAPAGINRGRLTSVLDIEYNPTQGERDALYGSGNAVNAIVNFTQQGITVWGQRTLQRTSTALDRVNVRMLMIYLKKNISELLRSFVFEQNDDTTRSRVLSTVNPFLGDVAARRGLTAYNVVCDASNNTPERIDRNELWVSVFVKPTRVAEFVVLNMVVLRTGANFGAQEILAAGGVVV